MNKNCTIHIQYCSYMIFRHLQQKNARTIHFYEFNRRKSTFGLPKYHNCATLVSHFFWVVLILMFFPFCNFMAPCDFCPIWYICRIFFPTWIPPNATKAYVTWQNIIKYFKNPPTHWLNYTSPLLLNSIFLFFKSQPLLAFLPSRPHPRPNHHFVPSSLLQHHLPSKRQRSFEHWGWWWCFSFDVLVFYRITSRLWWVNVVITRVCCEIN